MEVPLRLLRTLVDNRYRGRPPLSEKQREREERIIDATQALTATYSRDALTIGKLAVALRMTPTTIRRYFPDIETILAEILVRHLTGLYQAIGKVPHDDPNRRVLQRAAYIKVTRTEWGGLTEPHILLILARHTLPDDLAKPIEQVRQVIGELLGGENGAGVLALLDTPEMPAAKIEAMLANTAPAPQAPKPAEPLAPAPATHKPHYRDWRAAKREKKLLARAARAAAAPNSS
jgi:AcrR family transcriptional regulator